MKKYTISQLAKIICPDVSELISADSCISGVSIDSRTVKAGDVFFAIPGENFDGADYLDEVFSKGAVCAVVCKGIPRYIGDEKTVLKVDNTIKALGCLANHYRRENNFKVIAITGSAGKTTTRHITYHVLKGKYSVVQSPKNYNTEIGLPLTLLSANPDVQIIVAELGSNKPGEIAALTQIAQPDIALVTNVYPVHLEGFKNLETIIHEKISISGGLRPGGIFIINGDFKELVNTCRDKNIKFTTFGCSRGCDIRAENISHNNNVTSFTLSGTKIRLSLPGLGNVQNAAAAWAISGRLGLTIDDFARSVEDVPFVPMRAEIIRLNSVTVLNDCYNASPASMKNALDILCTLGKTSEPQKPPRRIFICGDMAELGEKSFQLHRQLGNDVAQAKINLLITVGDLAKIVAQTAKQAADYGLEIFSYRDNLSVCNNLQKIIKDSDIVLVKGSRTARLEVIVDKLKELFG